MSSTNNCRCTCCDDSPRDDSPRDDSRELSRGSRAYDSPHGYGKDAGSYDSPHGYGKDAGAYDSPRGYGKDAGSSVPPRVYGILAGPNGGPFGNLADDSFEAYSPFGIESPYTAAAAAGFKAYSPTVSGKRNWSQAVAEAVAEAEPQPKRSRRAHQSNLVIEALTLVNDMDSDARTAFFRRV